MRRLRCWKFEMNSEAGASIAPDLYFCTKLSNQTAHELQSETVGAVKVQVLRHSDPIVLDCQFQPAFRSGHYGDTN